MWLTKSRLVLGTLLAASVSVNAHGEDRMSNGEASGFSQVLHADGPAPEHADKLALYGQFVGDWDADVVTYTPDGTRHQGQGEVHFGWVLQGRAVQDVWMIPRLKDRKPGIPAMPLAGNWYGTTVRAYDPALDVWHIYWIDPATNAYYQQTGRQQGADIVQEGATPTGALSRWSFTEITPRSFHWKGEVSADKGVSWHLLVEVFARRTSGG